MIINSNARYAKQIKVSHFGEEGQKKLKNSHVAIVGVGALGCIVAEQLTRAGVGKLTLIDRDFVELSNLQRQQLYTEQDVISYMPKSIAACDRLKSINSTITINPIVSHLNSNNINQCLDEAELIIDATDNLSTRYLINEYAVREKKAWIHGAVASTYGRMLFIRPGETPCFNCLYPITPELDGLDTCDTVGVLSSIVNIIGSLQVTEALKWLIDKKDCIASQLIEFDVWNHQLLKIDVHHAMQANCPVCVHKQYKYLGQHISEPKTAILCGRNTVQVVYAKLNQHTFEHYVQKFSEKFEIMRNKYLCKVTYKSNIITFFPDGRCLIQGTDNIEEAETIISIIFDF